MANNGGLDVLMDKMSNTGHAKLKFYAAKLIMHCLVTENRGYVVEKGLKKMVDLSKQYTVRHVIILISMGLEILFPIQIFNRNCEQALCHP